MCVTLEEQQFPVGLSCRMRLCKLFVAAVDVEVKTWPRQNTWEFVQKVKGRDVEEVRRSLLQM